MTMSKKILISCLSLMISGVVFASTPILLPVTNMTNCVCDMGQSGKISCSKQPGAIPVYIGWYNPQNPSHPFTELAKVNPGETKYAPVGVTEDGSNGIEIAQDKNGNVAGSAQLSELGSRVYAISAKVSGMRAVGPINANWIDPNTCQYKGPASNSLNFR